MEEGQIIGIVGGLGQGKTLTSVVLGMQALKMGRRVVSNYKTKMFEFMNEEDLDEFMNDDDKWSGYVIIIDEISIFLDSRESGKKANKLATRFLKFLRKRGNTLIWSDQFMHMCDKRLRSFTSELWLPTNLKIGGKPTGYFLITKYRLHPLRGDFYFSGRSLVDGSKYYDCYNTREIINRRKK